jgi:DNA-binding transcriptional LysR family regulator
LADQSWIISTLTGGEALISNFARSGLRRPAILMRVNSFQLIMDMIETTDWVTFLPIEIVNQFYPNRFAPLSHSGFEFKSAILILNSPDLEMSLSARALMSQVKAFLQTIR